MIKFVSILLILLFSTCLNSQSIEKNSRIKILTLKSSHENYNRDSLIIDIELPLFYSEERGLDSNILELNKIVIEQINLRQYLLKQDDSITTYPLHSEVEIGFSKHYIDSQFVSILIFNYENSYEIIEDTLKNYFKPIVINSSINFLLNSGLVDLNKSFTENGWIEFKNKYDSSNSEFNKIDFFYLDDLNSINLRFSIMHIMEKTVNISINELFPYLKSNDSFTKYLKKLATK